MRLRDGRTLRRREAINRGCGDRPLADSDIVAKFTDNATRLLSRDAADALCAHVLALEDAANASAWAAGLSAP